MDFTEPDLREILDNTIEDGYAEFNCHRVGKIVSFDPATQTATIALVDKGVRKTIDGEVLQDFSLLINCPTISLKGQNGGLTIPIIAGDTCLVLFNDRDIDNWFEDGLTQRPASERMHDLADGIALVGLRSKANPIANYNNEATELNYLDCKISLTSKVEIKNAAENLKLILDDLITALNNLKVVDPVSGELPINAATASSLSDISTRLANLLK